MNIPLTLTQQEYDYLRVLLIEEEDRLGKIEPIKNICGIHGQLEKLAFNLDLQSKLNDQWCESRMRA
ncbi:MAG: hypothetical protein WC959_07565 [Kiritimatiellales bacterium]